jgi:hypothetical protein
MKKKTKKEATAKTIRCQGVRAFAKVCQSVTPAIILPRKSTMDQRPFAAGA